MSTLVRSGCYLRHGDGWRGCLKLVEEKFKVTNNNELSLPAFLHPTWLGHLDVSLVRRPNPLGGVDTQRSLGLVRRHGTHGWHSVLAADMTGEPADLADHALSGQSDHEAGAVVTLQGGGEGPDEELVRFWLEKAGGNVGHSCPGSE